MAVVALPKIEKQTKITYQLVKSVCKTHGAEGETVYGVEAFLSRAYNNYAKVEDVSANQCEVEQLIFILQKWQVTPEQLYYVVEDYIDELST